jgi:hypothetical protein
MKPMVGSFAGCCAFASNGQVAAAQRDELAAFHASLQA